MGHNSPLALVNLTGQQQGAIPKGLHQRSTPKERLSSCSKEPSYADLEDDPRQAQRQILEQCVVDNTRPRDPTKVVIVADHHTRRMDRETTHTESLDVANRSQEQIDCIQFLAEEQRSRTVKEGVMESISETLQCMNLKQIRRFEQSLPENLSQARRSRRLMGTDPEVYHTTGNKTEDARIIMNNGRVFYRK